MIPFSELLQEQKPFLGTFVQSASPEFVEASAYAGFRFAAIDLEHTYYGVEKMNTGAEEGEGLLAQAEDDDNTCGYFGSRKACLPLSTDGIMTVQHFSGILISAASAVIFYIYCILTKLKFCNSAFKI